MRNRDFPLVSIIIVNWNGGEVFRNCLSSLSKLSYPNWELVVVDNGSSDESEKSPEDYGEPLVSYRLIKNKKNLGFAMANNQGFKIARGEFVLLLNNDTKVPADFLTKLVEKVNSDQNLGVIQPKLRIMDRPEYLDNAGSFMTRIGFLRHWGFMKKDSAEFGKEREVFSAKGACMLIPREVIEKVGLFDPDFVSYFEESDFCWRVWLAGYKVIFYPQVEILHKVGFTVKRQDVFQINFHYYKNRICSLIKNLELYNLIPILSAHILISFGIATVFVLRGKPANSLMIFRAIWWNLTNLRKTLKKRKIIQKQRKIKDGQLFTKLMVPVNWSEFFADFKRVEKDILNKGKKLPR